MFAPSSTPQAPFSDAVMPVMCMARFAPRSSRSGRSCWLERRPEQRSEERDVVDEDVEADGSDWPSVRALRELGELELDLFERGDVQHVRLRIRCGGEAVALGHRE